MELTFGLAAVIGIAPAMIMMYAVLRKYTYPAVKNPFFSDPTFFMLFVVGLIAGTVLFSVYTYFWGNVVINAIMFSLLECLILLVVLNLKKFHGKSDTVFYGYGLGLGLGATMSMGMTYYLLELAGSIDAPGIVILIIMAVSKTMVLGAAGLTVGEAVAKTRIAEFTAQAVLVNMVFQLVLVPWFMYSEGFGAYLALAMSLVIAAAYFYKTAFVSLPNVVREVLRQEGKKRDDIPR
ncbi:MAG: hypothetical protein VB016_00930 [Methanomassiliicoccaceae archaeon]|nr:hypothetical protein [Methanomassiliicoccaceae archaeon]